MTALSALHATKNKAPIDEDAFRDICERVTGKRSTKVMSDKQRWMVVDELKRLYPAIKQVSKPRPDSRKKLTGAYAKKLQALWIGAWNLGIVNNRDDAALLAFVKRQTGIDHTRFLRYPVDANKAIEALKAWMAREAGVDWSVSQLRHDYKNHHGYQISNAQWNKLHGHDADIDRAFVKMCVDILKVSGSHGFNADRILNCISDNQWQSIMNDLGKRIREKKAAA